MFTQLDYQSKIPSPNNVQPNFMAVIALTVQGCVDSQSLLDQFSSLFDIDVAVGDQLDKIAVWVGGNRSLPEALPPSGITELNDTEFRLLLFALIAANYWDGTVPGIYSIWGIVFSGNTFDVLVQDNQDMTMFIVITATTFGPVVLALIAYGYFDLKPAGVGMLGYWQPSIPDTPVFGWGVENSTIAGWGVGCWIEPLEV